jgi:type II secretory pathway pseudopilin PulG
LLVVIAIISVLAAMLVPAVQGALERARAIACVNNLRQIYVAQVGYANDHDGSTTAARYEGAWRGVLSQSSWMGRLATYVGLEQIETTTRGSAEQIRTALRGSVYWCPALPGLDNHEQHGYAQNQFVAWDQAGPAMHISPLKREDPGGGGGDWRRFPSQSTTLDAASSLAAPSQILFFSDVHQYATGWSTDGFDYLWRWNPLWTIAYTAQRHGDAANVLTLGGNVVPVKPGELDAFWVIQK